MARWAKLLGGCLALLAGILLILSLWLPGKLIATTTQTVRERFGRELTVGSLTLNPLTLAVEVGELQLTDRASPEAFFSCRRLRVAFSFRSLWARAPIIREAQLVEPWLRLRRDGPNLYNFSDLMIPAPPEPASPSPPLQFSLNNLVLSDGRIEFADLAAQPPQTHTVRDLQLSIPVIGNLPYLADRYVLPALRATVDNSPIEAQGRLKPFSDTLEASLRLRFSDLDLVRFVGYLPTDLPVRIGSGRLATEIEVTYQVSPQGVPLLRVGGEATLTGLAVASRQGAPLLFLPLLQARLEPANLLERNLTLGALTVYNPELHLERGNDGLWNLQRLLSPAGPAEIGAASTPPLQIAVVSTRLRGGKVHLVDRLPSLGFAAELFNIDIDLGRLASGGGAATPTPFSIALDSERGEVVKVTGQVRPQPLQLAADLHLQGLPLADYYPYLEPFLVRPVRGTLAAGAHLAVDPTASWSISGGTLDLAGVGTEFLPGEGLEISRLRLAEGSYAPERGLAVGSIVLEEGRVALSRSPEGRLSPLPLLREAPPAGPAAPASPAPLRPWRIDAVTVRDLRIGFRDLAVPAAPHFQVDIETFQGANLAGPAPSQATLDLTARVQGEGTVAFNGTLDPAAPRLAGAVRLQRVPLPEFMAYAPPRLQVTLVQGLLDGRLKFDCSFPTTGPTGSFSGGLGVRKLYTVDNLDGNDLVRWESLQLEGLRGAISPLELHLEKVALNDFAARIIVNPDGTLNLQQVLAKEAAPAPGSTAPTPAPPPPSPRISIGAVTLQNGRLDFRDLHLQPEYATTMVNLGGRISGLSSAGDTQAEVDLRGNLENQSPLRITGMLNPLSATPLVDLKVNFTDIELAPLTPYSGTYLGYSLEKGKLFLELAYRIEDHRLNASNRIFIDQFTFGQRVESERATGLPVRLAVALLKDRKGEIHLDLPLTGRTDDPQFSLFRVVLQMLRNLLVKAATAPFSLLAALFGGDGEDFSSVYFPYGGTRLAEPEQEKLRKLAAVLLDRPALKLEVQGFVGREVDAEGYRREELARQVRMAKYLELAKARRGADLTPETVAVPAAEYPLYLAAAYRRADFPKPRNFLGMHKGLPDSEMEKLLLANIVVGDAQYASLAKARAMVVQRYLVDVAGLPPERVFLTQGEIFKAPAKDGESAARVEFGVAAD